jgi:hypothetical protein
VRSLLLRWRGCGMLGRYLCKWEKVSDVTHHHSDVGYARHIHLATRKPSATPSINVALSPSFRYTILLPHAIALDDNITSSPAARATGPFTMNKRRRQSDRASKQLNFPHLRDVRPSIDMTSLYTSSCHAVQSPVRSQTHR